MGMMDMTERTAVGSWLRRLAAIATLLVALLAVTSPASATDALPTTNDQSTTLGTAHWWYHGLTASQVSERLTANNARLTQIRVDDGSVPTFTVTMVSNTGPYATAWWWYYGVDAQTLANYASANSARLISVEPYWAGGTVRFAGVMVANTGAANRGWWFYWGQPASNIEALATSLNARPISLRPYWNGSSTVYAVLYLQNTGSDARAWRFYLHRTLDELIALS